MNHLDEKTLALYALEAPEVQSQRTEIENHLKTCPGCSALFRDITQYYEEFEDLDRQEVMQTAITRYAPERAISRDVLRELSGVTAGPLSLQQRFVVSLFRHPVRWSAGFAAVLLMFILFVPRISFKDTNPSFARAKEGFLVAYNKGGQELWRKFVAAEFDYKDPTAEGDVRVKFDHAVKVIDVDRDGKNDVIFIFGWGNLHINSRISRENVIVCFGPDGHERWSYELHRYISFGRESFTDDYRFYFLTAGDFDRDGDVEIYAAASQVPWYPNVLVKLRAWDGAFLGEYWNPGEFLAFSHLDIDGDGIEELFFSNEHNLLRRGGIAVLDPRFIQGHAPVPTSYSPVGIEPGKEKFYLLLPTPEDVLRANPSTYAWTVDVRRSGQLIESQLLLKPSSAGLLFYFDHSLRCVQVKPSDSFTALHEQLEREGKVRQKVDAKYLETLRESVQYWDGSKFDKKPMTNEGYKELLRSSPMSRR